MTLRILTRSLSLLFFCSFFTLVFGQSIQWATLNEPGAGGRIADIAISPYDPEVVFVTGDMLGIGYSDDRAESWQTTFGLNSYEMAAVTFHPTDPAIVWCGSMSGPYKSEDGGRNWALMREGMDPIKEFGYSCPIEIVVYDPANSSRLLAFGGSKRDWNSPASPRHSVVWESLDNGDNWAYLSTVGVEQRPGVTSAAFAGAGKIVVSARTQGLYISSDGGASWSISMNGMPAGTDVYSVAVDPSDPLIMYASTGTFFDGSTNQPGGIYKSVDGGLNWVYSSTGLQQQANSFALSASYYQTVKVAPSNPAVLWTANSGYWGAGVFRSTDAGATWSAVLTKGSTGNFPATFYDAAGPGLAMFGIDPADEDIFIGGGSSKVLMTSDGGVNWRDKMSQPTSDPNYFRGSGYSGLVSRNVAFNPYDPQHIVLQAMDNGKFVHSRDGGATWRRAGTGMSEYSGGNAVAFASASVIWATTGQADFDGVWKSEDQGATWVEYSIGSFPGASASARPFDIHTIPGSGTTAWVALDGRLYGTTDNGATWQVLLAAPGIESISAASDSPLHFYVAADDGIYETFDGLNFSLMPGSPSLAAMVVADPVRADVVYATKWRTNDGEEGLWKYEGDTKPAWKQLRSDYYLRSVAVNPEYPSVLIVGTDDNPFHDKMNSTGFWTSVDGGETWVNQVKGLPLERAYVVAFNPHNPRQLIAGTGGRGFFKGEYLGKPTARQSIPESSKVRIFPNPASEFVQIDLPLSQADMQLIDLNGKVIFQKSLQRGLHTIPLDGFVPGVYILTLKGEGTWTSVSISLQ